MNCANLIHKKGSSGSRVVWIEVCHWFLLSCSTPCKSSLSGQPNCFHGQFSSRQLNKELLPIEQPTQVSSNNHLIAVFTAMDITSIGTGFCLRPSPDWQTSRSTSPDAGLLPLIIRITEACLYTRQLCCVQAFVGFLLWRHKTKTIKREQKTSFS